MRGKAKATAIVAVASLALASSAAAKTYQVTKRGDPTPNGCKKKACSLREAVIAANNHPGPDKVALPERKTYSLRIANDFGVPGEAEDAAQTGDLDVTGPLRVSHKGKGRAKVDANGIDRAFELHEGGPATFKRLVVRGGDDPDGAEGDGGGIKAAADLTLMQSKVTRNHATRYGGGVDIEGGPDPDLPIDFLLIRSRIVGNRSDDDSGAADLDGGGDVTIKRSVVSNNDAGGYGAMYLYADAGKVERIAESTIAGNHSDDNGGGVYVSNDDAASAEFVGSTVSGNDTDGTGGGIYLDSGAFRVANSTLAGNTAAGEGGGIYGAGSGPASLNAVTVVRNSTGVAGGGLFSFLGPGGFAVENSVIGLNTSAALGADCAGDEFDSQGHNLLGTDAECLGFDATGDFVNPNPKLGQLKSNGGPTQTVALKKGSPAINKASKASAPKKDQRGVKRGKKPDIGAFERVKKKKHHHHRH